ncbi:MAG TPA: DoxX family membrane protein [Kofleriaceae bacterium]|nr:DoxX family membrane protein [Kofleriaceae bacterium]
MIRTIARWALTVVMVAAGANHFIATATYVGMMPAELPAHLALVYISGIAEIAGGLGLILPQTRKLAAYGLIALFIAVFPANLNMALNHLPLGTTPVPTWALWARLPLQVVFILWAWAVSRTPEQSPRRS